MAACDDLGRRVDELAALDAAALPAWAMDHLASCPACARLLRRARLTRGLLAIAKEGAEPPTHFAQRVLAALPATRSRGATDPELWGLGWRLVPAFAATAALMLVLFQFEAPIGAPPASLAPSLASGLAPGLVTDEGLSASERLVLGTAQPDLDLVLAAVMEMDGT
jgi:hypothetical protein